MLANSEFIARSDDGLAAQVGKGEGRSAVAAELRAEQGEQGRVLRYRQETAVAGQEAVGDCRACRGDDFTEERFFIIAAGQIA